MTNLILEFEIAAPKSVLKAMAPILGTTIEAQLSKSGTVAKLKNIKIE